MKTSFSDIDSEDTKPVENLPAVKQETAIVSDDFFENELPTENLRTPRLELTHAVGFGLTAGFSPGSLVYNRDEVLHTPKTAKTEASAPVNVIVLKAVVHYEEKLTDAEFKAKKEAGELGGVVTYKSERDARAAGLVSGKEKRDNPKLEAPVFHPVMKVLALVGGNALSSGLPVTIDGKQYVVAEIILAKGSYWKAGQSIAQAVSESRMYQTKVYRKSFNFAPKLEAYGSGDPSWAIHSTPGPRLTDDGVKVVEELMARMA